MLYNINDIYCLTNLSSEEECQKIASKILVIQKEQGFLGSILEQFDDLSLNWKNIRKIHFWIEKIDRLYPNKNFVSHVNFPLEEKEKILIAADRDYLVRIAKGLNSECWHFISFWLSIPIQKNLISLPLTATEEFRLEADLKNFLIETQSLFLKALKNEIKIIFKNMTSIENPAEILTLETKLIRVWQDLLRLLEQQHKVLIALESSIAAVIKEHAELKNLSELVTLYKALLDDEFSEKAPFNVEKRLLIFHLLLLKLNLFCISLGEIKDPLFQKVIAQRLALSEIYKTETSSRLVEMALNFGKGSPFENHFKALGQKYLKIL